MKKNRLRELIAKDKLALVAKILSKNTEGDTQKALDLLRRDLAAIERNIRLGMLTRVDEQKGLSEIADSLIDWIEKLEDTFTEEQEEKISGEVEEVLSELEAERIARARANESRFKEFTSPLGKKQNGIPAKGKILLKIFAVLAVILALFLEGIWIKGSLVILLVIVFVSDQF